jgi:hypothetical protein
MFWIRVVEKIKTHILYSVTFLFENRAVYEIMWKNVQYNTAHALCVEDNEGYIHTHIQNT